MSEHTKRQRDFWNETAKYQRFVVEVVVEVAVEALDINELRKRQREFWNESAKYHRFEREKKKNRGVVEEQIKKILEEFPNVRDMTIPKSYSKVYVKPKEDIITGNSGRGMAKGGRFLFKAISMRDGRRYLVFRPDEKSMSLGKMGSKSTGELFCTMEKFIANKDKMEFM